MIVNRLFFLYKLKTMSSFSKITCWWGIDYINTPESIRGSLSPMSLEVAKILHNGDCFFEALFCSPLVRDLLLRTNGESIRGFREWASNQICQNPSYKDPALVRNISRLGWYGDHRFPSIIASLLQDAIPGLWIGLLTINGEHASLCGVAEGDMPKDIVHKKAVILVRHDSQEHFDVLVWGGVSRCYAQNAHEASIKEERQAAEGHAATQALLAQFTSEDLEQMRMAEKHYLALKRVADDAAFAEKLQNELLEMA